MGRQVNFYMTAADEREFIELLKQSGDLVILPHVSPTPDFPPVKALPPPLSAPFWGDVWLCSSRPRSRIVTRFVSGQSYYVVDEMRSELVELSRSYEKDWAVHRGRVAAELAYPDPRGEAWLSKPRWFVEWYGRIAGWIRAKYRRLDPLVYASPRALKLQEEGWELK